MFIIQPDAALFTIAEIAESKSMCKEGHTDVLCV